MSDKSAILYCANSGDIIGGGQISLLNLLQRLNRKRFYPVVICPATGSLYDALQRLSIETLVVPMETIRTCNVAGWIKTILKIKNIIQRKHIRLIHSNGSRATIYAGISARITKVSLIWHVRIADTDRLLDKILSRLASKIVVISKAVHNRFGWVPDKKKIHLLYNGIDTQKFRPGENSGTIRRKLGIDTSATLIGAVGRLDWYKGYEYLLEAVPKVLKAVPAAHFVIAGEGDLREKLIRLTKSLHIDRNIHFLGNRTDVIEVLKDIDLFVSSSVSEGFGRATAEAMACAKPVVSTSAGGLAEVVENKVTGICVPPKNVTKLAEAIVELIQNKVKAQTMGMAGRKRVETLFSIEQNVKCIEGLYESMLS